MTTLDEYFNPRATAEQKHAIIVNVTLFNVVSAHCLVANPVQYALNKLRALLDVIYALQVQEGYATVNSIRDRLLVEGLVKSTPEASRLLKLAHRVQLIREGHIPSTWIVPEERYDIRAISF